MAAQTIHAQIEELTGTESLASLDDWAGDALDKLVMILPYEFLIAFGSTEACTYTGVYTELTAKNKRILEVVRAPSAGSLSTRPCSFISQAEYLGKYADTNSLHYPSDYDPKWTILADTVKVLPAVSGMVVTSKYIALVGTLDTTGTALSTLPYTCEYLIVLDLASRVVLTKIQGLAQAAFSAGAVAPTTPTLGTVSYVNASAGTVATVSFGAIPTAPTYTAGSLPAGFTTALAAFDTAMTTEDIELAMAQANKAKEYLDQYQLLIQEANQSFQSAVKKWDGDVTKLIKQAEIDMAEAQAEGKMTHDVNLQNAIQTAEAIFKNNTSLIQKYQGDVAKYTNQIQSEVTAYQVNTARVSSERDRYLALYQSFKQEYHEQLFLKFGIQTVSTKNEK
jgi:hypothetical protein